MLCHQCGSPVTAEDTSCPNCGATLNKSAKKRTSAVKGRNFAKFTTQLRAVTEDDKPLIDPKTVLSGRFALEEVLGKGPMGQVFVGKDQETGDRIAIKVFDPKLFPTNKDLNRFKTTMGKAKSLKHDNLVSVLGCGVLSKKPWMAMDFVEGLSLAKVHQLRQSKKEHFTRDEIKDLIGQVLPALSTMQSAHGALTPSNIYVWSESYLVSDYAMMSALPPGAWRTVRKDDPFLAPELSTKTKQITEKQDVYSIGAIISELLFDSTTVPPKGDIDAQWVALADVCRQATNTDPRRRHASLRSLRTALDDALVASASASLAAPAGLEELSSPPPLPPGLEEQSSVPPPPPMTAPPAAPMAPPTAPAGVEPVIANKDATQVLADDEVDIVEEASTAPKAPESPKATKTTRKTRRKNKRPMPKDEEVAATAISGSGQSKKEGDNSDDLATIEINRSAPELGDLLPTNDFERDKIPPPREPKLERESTKTVVEPKRSAPSSSKDDDKGGIPPWMIILGIAMVIVIGVIAMSSGKKKVTIKDEDPIVTKHDTPKTDTKVDPPKTDTKPNTPEADATPDTKVSASTTEANQKLVAAKASALDASNKAAEDAAKNASADPKTDTKTDPKVDPKTDPKTDTKAIASTKANTKTDNGSSSSKTNTKTTNTGSKVDPKTDSAKAVAAGTACPRGMVLVKSKKSGNICVDRYEYPGAGRPKTNVSWFQAVKLCQGRGKRLCALKEWRRACGSRYPGSSKWNPDRCNTQDEDEVERELTSVGKFKRCRSRSGAYDMTGNAHEWVAEKLIAGGGFDSGPSVAKCSYASRKSPSSKASYIGFRCCADPK